MQPTEQLIRAARACSRRLVGAALVLTAALCTPGLSAAQTPTGQNARRPNIIVILADDVGREAFGSYGGTSYQTPNLDRLAAEGIRFTRGYATPICTPTRVQLMTGKQTFRNYDRFGELAVGERTFANYLKSAGYATAVAGKWQLSNVGGEREATNQDPHHFGFDEYLLWQLGGPDFWARYKNPSLTRSREGYRSYEGKFGPDLFQDFVLDFIERHRDGPFLVYYPTPTPHDPFQPPPGHPDWDTHDPGSTDDPKYFGSMLAYLDGQVGALVAKLDELGIRENTLVFFVGDNGTHPRVTSMMNGRAVQGDKGNTRDEGIHVPYIVNWKGTIARGQVRDDLVDVGDIFPTLMEAAGVTIRGRPTDMVSLYPTLVRGVPHSREWIFHDYYLHRTAGPNPERSGRANVVVARYALNTRYKLYSDGRFFEYVADPEEERPLALNSLAPDARRAREELQRVMKQMEAEIRAVESRRPSAPPADPAPPATSAPAGGGARPAANRGVRPTQGKQ